MQYFWIILTVCYFVETINGEFSRTPKLNFIMKKLDNLARDFQDLHSKYESLEAENVNIKRELATDKRKRLLESSLKEGSQSTVGFYARRKQSGLIGLQQTIEFEHIHENHGNGYDSSHGHFTAPVSGLYAFSTTIYSGSAKSIDCEIVKNGQNLGSLHAPAPGYSSSTLNVVIYLNVGDMVWVRHTGSTPQELNANDYSTFSGFLISI
ncbi:complement C1q-like protein 4 isoform X1 [Mytilus edulis]|uniref:complement C1q-like protein 4 isoform X1 n=1 Tax=Mytilus edulis TaxID=6550 RepID=UPI0039F02607